VRENKIDIRLTTNEMQCYIIMNTNK